MSLRIVASDRMNALLERLRRDARLFGSHAPHIVPLWCQARESSEVARVRVVTPTESRHVFAKIFNSRPGETGLVETRRRFRQDCSVTRSVFEATKSTGELRSVETIASYEDLLGMVTNEVSGLPLNAVITQYAAWPASASRLEYVQVALSRVGRWIEMFQRVVPDAEPSKLSLDATRAYIDVRLQKLRGLPRARFSETDRRAVLSYFDRLAAEVTSADLVEVPVHGDIVPSNIIVDRDSITVLDFGMTARGSKYLDVARFYTQLGFYSAKPQYRPQVIARLQERTLAAFQPGLRDDHPLFAICALQHVVCHFLSHARQPGRFPASFYSAHLIRRHRRWLRARAATVALLETGPIITHAAR